MAMAQSAMLHEFLAMVTFHPDSISMAIVKETTAGQEALGIITYALKALMRLVPIVFGVGVLIFTIFILIDGVRRARRFSFDYFVLAGCLAAYVGILACNVFYFFNNQAFIWTLVGYGLAHARLINHWDQSPMQEAQLLDSQVVMVTGS